MRLSELNPRWLRTDLGREGMGIAFDCPGECCRGAAIPQRLSVWFEKPIDGGIPAGPAYGNGLRWKRVGESFDDLTLHPSIDTSSRGHWHGWIVLGDIR